jgi:hypothetical protein
LLVVQGWPTTQEASGDGEHIFNAGIFNRLLAEGEKAHSTNYWGCRHVKEVCKRESQRALKTTKGRLFSSNLTTPCLSFAAVLRSNTATAAATPTLGCSGTSSHNGPKHPCTFVAPTTTGNRSVRAPNINSLPLDNMFKIVTVLKQIMTEFNGAFVRGRENSDHYKNCLNYNEVRWSLLFIGLSKSQH